MRPHILAMILVLLTGCMTTPDVIRETVTVTVIPPKAMMTPVQWPMDPRSLDGTVSASNFLNYVLGLESQLLIQEGNIQRYINWIDIKLMESTEETE